MWHLLRTTFDPLACLARLAPYRRLSARLGLQGKLVICFVALMVIGLCTSTSVFLARGEAHLSTLLGEHATQLSHALAQASKPALAANNTARLTLLGKDLVRSQNILFVAFLDPRGRPIAAASRDQDFAPAVLSTSTRAIDRPTQLYSPVLGQYVQAVAPVTDDFNPDSPPKKLLGYVAIGVSISREQAALRAASLSTIGTALVVVGLSLPLAWILINRVFLPIRELVDATRRIAAGDLAVAVSAARSDLIGQLARSFNEMVEKVHAQQLQLACANAELEQKVADRTFQLESANARLTREIAEKEDFLRAVSHDLNAPLRNISGMASMLLMKHREKFDDDVVHRLERIRKNVEVETDLIGELLELSRIKTRRQKVEPVDVAAVVAEVADVFEQDLTSKRISLLIDTPFPTLAAERARLRQVFQNLIDNAIKYMGPGPVREIHVGCHDRPDAVEFYVRDTGIGIHPDDLPRVFHIFRRGRNTLAAQVAGKGVGLSSVKSIVETYDGEIHVESTPDQGSTFRFTIARKHVLNPESPRPPRDARPPTQPGAAAA